MNFKGIIFKSKYTRTIYLWNGTSVVCVLAPKDPQYKKDREIGTFMNGFKDVETINLNNQWISIEP